MPKLWELPAWKVCNEIKRGNITVDEYLSEIFERISTVEDKIHSFITITKEEALKKGKEIQARIARKENVGNLCGIAVAVKDNICTRGIRTTCASRMLMNYIPPYDATVIERLKKEDAILIGKTNMDEFAMGASTETSYFGPTRNPWDFERVPGGSSGGSAAAVAIGEATLALGSDTGGSIRCPASFCGVVGLKPTYGLVSRFGLISYASSLEQIGPITRDVRDCALLLNCISGYDKRDSTSVNRIKDDYMKYLINDVSKMRIGVPREFFMEGVEEIVAKNVWNAILKLEELGASYEEISIKTLVYALPAYYIIALSEASSNLARYDGIKYGYRINEMSLDWEKVVSRNRGLGFGLEVKRRIILGTFALSAGLFEQYYLKAQRIRYLLKKELEETFQKFDVIIGPTMPILPFKIGERISDPVQLYMCDINTVPANLTGLPAISVPCGSYNGLPIGLQIIAPAFREGLLFRVAFTLERNIQFKKYEHLSAELWRK